MYDHWRSKKIDCQNFQALAFILLLIYSFLSKREYTLFSGYLFLQFSVRLLQGGEVVSWRMIAIQPTHRDGQILREEKIFNTWLNSSIQKFLQSLWSFLSSFKVLHNIYHHWYTSLGHRTCWLLAWFIYIYFYIQLPKGVGLIHVDGTLCSCIYIFASISTKRILWEFSGLFWCVVSQITNVLLKFIIKLCTNLNE